MKIPRFIDNRRSYRKRNLFVVVEPTRTDTFLEIKWVRPELERTEMTKHLRPRQVTLQGLWKDLDYTYTDEIYTFACGIKPETLPHIEVSPTQLSLYGKKEERISYHPECYQHVAIHRQSADTLQFYQQHNMLVLRFLEDLNTLKGNLFFPLHFRDNVPRA